MFENKIQFSIHPDLLDDEEQKPILSKKDIPKWYKNLANYSTKDMNIKGCIPVRDLITSGYLLKLPTDLHINFNHFNPALDKNDVTMHFGRLEKYNLDTLMRYNINYDLALHNIEQLGNQCPHVKRNKYFSVAKILNPWLIKTPPGYSCLFIPPQHRSRDYFEILPAIVDTDTYGQHINFPFVWCGEKKENYDVVISKGTPYVQVIPFKREAWKMSVKDIDVKKLQKFSFKYASSVINTYLTKFWKKKSWN